jgi:hypothetical protein
MRTIIILLLLCSLAYAGNADVETGFGYISEDGKVIEKIQRDIGTKVQLQSGQTYTEVESVEALSAVELFKYDADDLISWALSQVFAEALIPHMAAFLDFANKATEVSKTNFLAYAQAVGLTSTANTIVSKAIELGADL